MKKTDVKKLHEETEISLRKKASIVKSEIATLRVQAANNPPKDSNVISKKVRELAVLLTIANQKREV